MKNRPIIIAIAAVAIVLIIIVIAWKGRSAGQPSAQDDTVSTTIVSNIPAFDHSVSDGKIIISYPGDEFELAEKPDQILAHAYIPPCDTNFIYCLYATSTAYQGTNFESAGLRIQKRSDLKTERTCLNTPPEGYNEGTLPNVSTSTSGYASSGFLSKGDAGAGHYASGSLYRLFIRPSSPCYEFETRIGETQFMNYPTGTIKEFTVTNKAAVNSLMNTILSRVTLQSGKTGLFTF